MEVMKQVADSMIERDREIETTQRVRESINESLVITLSCCITNPTQIKLQRWHRREEKKKMCVCVCVCAHMYCMHRCLTVDWRYRGSQTYRDRQWV